MIAGTAHYPGIGNVVYQAVLVGDDPAEQVEAAIGQMRHMAAEDARDPEIQRLAGVLRAGLDPADPEQARQIAARVFWHVKGLLRFQQDEVTAAPLRDLLPGAGDGTAPIIESFVRPAELVRMAQSGLLNRGDCDDFSMLLAALLEAAGVPASFVTLAADGRDPRVYSHVYVEAAGMALDASHGPYPGWEAPNRYGMRRVWPVTGVDPGTLAMLAVAAVVGCWWLRTKARRAQGGM